MVQCTTVQRETTMRTILYLIATLPGLAQAAPVTWTLEGVTFDDGTALTGTFIFDAEREWTPVDPPGSIYGVQLETTWRDYDNPPCINASTDAVDCEDGQGSIFIGFASPLTGGTVAISGGAEFFAGEFREIVGGSVTAVPVPAAFWLFLSALIVARCRWKPRKY